MIKFFRKIRQKLLSENKFSKYLIYAIGEIFLVVIGILIALQINNHNEARKLKQKEIILLSEMKSNLQADLLDLNYNIDNNKTRLESNVAVRSTIENNTLFSDSLRFHFGNVMGNFQLTENTSAWENLKSIGLDLISDDSLRNSLSNLYSTKYKYLENLERGADDTFQWDHLYPQVLKHITIDELWVSGEPRNYEEMLEDSSFLEVIKMNITFRKMMQGQYERVLEAVTSVLEQIDKHLNYLSN